MQSFTLIPTETGAQLATRAQAYLKTLSAQERQSIAPNFNVKHLLQQRTAQVDHILCALFANTINDDSIALIAIGGYGRGELFPHSDVDLLILCPRSPDSSQRAKIKQFVTHLWSLGLDIAQSVRTPEQCLADAKNDLDTLTALLEARYLCGNRALLATINVTTPPLIAPLRFIALKIAEQRYRDDKQEQIGRLEPNVKIAPGGLRDLHMLAWVNRYVYQSDNLDTLLSQQILSPEEYDHLRHSTEALWRIRFALHLHNQGAKDQLLFERQKRLAKQFHYQDNEASLGIEQFMRDYYRHCIRIRRINRLSIKLIQTAISPEPDTIVLDEHFEQRNQQLALRAPLTLQQRPDLIWALFSQLQNHPNLEGIHPSLARDILKTRHQLKPQTFHQDPANLDALLAILNHTGNVYRQIRRMHRYGLLQRIIPDFALIVGQMQYDLFHQYTVDQHSLHLMRYLDSFKTDNAAYPQAHTIYKRLRYPALLYLAALFHDIGKGRHGDHSEIGAQIMHDFCQRSPNLSARDGKLLTFLVRHHLALSHTAQKKDLSDPEVIKQFANLFPDQESLDYLYLLTLADVSATNDKLWNSWRASLFQQLYRLTQATLNTAPPSRTQLIQQAQQSALSLLPSNPDIPPLWAQLPHYFFINESAPIIASKTQQLLDNPTHHAVGIVQHHPSRLFVSSPLASDQLFARLTHFLEKQRLTIYEARLYHSHDKRLTLQQYTISDTKVPDQQFCAQLLEHLNLNIPPRALKPRLANQQLQHFNIATHINIEQDPNLNRTKLYLSCQDRQGLLSLISRIFLAHNIHLSHAKIATFGEKVADTFYLTDAKQRAITNSDTSDKLKADLINNLKKDIP